MSVPDGFEPFTEPGFMGHIVPLYRRVDDEGVHLGALVQPHQANPAGGAHGGFLMSIMDVTLGINCARALDHAGIVATIQLNANIMAAARIGEFVVSSGRIERITSTLAFASGRIAVGERTVMTATAIFRNPPR